MPAVVALVAGLIFGAGLTISQMVNPAKVLSFLDIGGVVTGAWDPSLAFVMAVAVGVAAIFYWRVRQRRGALVGASHKRIDGRLIAGAVLFGLGWGLAGYCPGPAISALAYGGAKTIVFVVAMAGGMLIYRLTARQS